MSLCAVISPQGNTGELFAGLKFIFFEYFRVLGLNRIDRLN
ncbi:hypothetical protein PN466_02870 [Roseofilum reptotaenium CS-1145]|nr:hypothetical protein [Roseofilum reptotaenium]MDB9515902.1 hypothetical protein [Roseofilum reptotaenium CS-1145]